MEFSAIEIIDRIKSAMTTKELDSLGYTPQIISKWKSRNTIPRSDDLYKIAKYLNVSMEYLLTGEKDSNELPPDEAELLRNYRLLSDEMKSMVSIQIGALSAK